MGKYQCVYSLLREREWERGGDMLNRMKKKIFLIEKKELVEISM